MNNTNLQNEYEDYTIDPDMCKIEEFTGLTVANCLSGSFDLFDNGDCWEFGKAGESWLWARTSTAYEQEYGRGGYQDGYCGEYSDNSPTWFYTDVYDPPMPQD